MSLPLGHVPYPSQGASPRCSRSALWKPTAWLSACGIVLLFPSPVFPSRLSPGGQAPYLRDLTLSVPSTELVLNQGVLTKGASVRIDVWVITT